MNLNELKMIASEILEDTKDKKGRCITITAGVGMLGECSEMFRPSEFINPNEITSDKAALLLDAIKEPAFYYLRITWPGVRGYKLQQVNGPRAARELLNLLIQHN